MSFIYRVNEEHWESERDEEWERIKDEIGIDRGQWEYLQNVKDYGYNEKEVDSVDE